MKILNNNYFNEFKKSLENLDFKKLDNLVYEIKKISLKKGRIFF